MENADEDLNQLLTSYTFFNGASPEIESYHRTFWLLIPDLLSLEGGTTYLNQLHNKRYVMTDEKRSSKWSSIMKVC